MGILNPNTESRRESEQDAKDRANARKHRQHMEALAKLTEAVTTHGKGRA